MRSVVRTRPSCFPFSLATGTGERSSRSGRIVTVGLGEQRSDIYFKAFVIKEATLIGSRVTMGEFPRAIRLMAKELLHPELLITHQMPMRDVATAFEKVDREEPETLKIVLNAQEW